MIGGLDWDLPPLRQGYPADDALADRRRGAAGAPGADAGIMEEGIGGVRCLIVEPEIGAPGGSILYLHGGGYRMGSPFAYVHYARRLAAATGRRVVLPFYRLAPEHPFPAALHDAVSVYRNMDDQASTLVAGDSAGGGLATALCIVAAQMGEPLPGAILISPMLDLAAKSESYERNAARDAYFSRSAVRDAASLYLQGHGVGDPLVSPIHADPADIPPTLILVGSAEVLLDEALAFTHRLSVADRRVTLHVAPGMGHVWPLLDAQSPAAAEAFAAMGAFVKGLTVAAP